MADKPSGSGAEKNTRQHETLSLQDILDAVAHSSSDEDSDEEFGDSSFDEDSEIGDEEVPIQFVSGEPCERDSWLLLDVSHYTSPLLPNSFDE